MKRRIVFLSMVALVVAVLWAGGALADTSGTCGPNASWQLVPSGTNYALKISGTGEMNSYSSSKYVPWHDHLDKIVSIEVGPGITTIGHYAFSDCNALTSVKLNEGLTAIGNYAFLSCNRLRSITIPDGVTTIGAYAFNNQLETIILPDTITSCSNNAFNNPKYITIGAYFVKNRIDNFFNRSGDASTNGVKSIVLLPSVTSLPANWYANSRGRDALNSISFRGAIEEIPTGAFQGCKALYSVALPEGLKRIGTSAFSGCQNLRGVALPEGLESIDSGAFVNTSINSVTLPSSLQSMGSQCFYFCQALTKLTIREGVESIGLSAFMDCDALTDVVIPASVKTLGSNAFSYCDKLAAVTIKSAAVQIGTYAFLGDKALKNVVFEGEITGVGDRWIEPEGAVKALVRTDSACAHCSGAGLTVTVCPDDVDMADIIEYGKCGDDAHYVVASDYTLRVFGESAIQDYAFTASYSDKHVTDLGYRFKRLIIDEGITHVGEWCFYNDDNIEAIVLPDSLQSAGREAFSSIDNLSSVTLPDHDFAMGDHFLYAAYALKEIHLPEGLTRIGDSMFSHCQTMTGINIPGTVKEIDKLAFNSCFALPSLTLPEGLLSIGDQAFWGNESLTTLTIPASVTTLGSGIFAYCKSLQDIVFAGTVPEATRQKPYFANTIIYIPHGTPSWEADAAEGMDIRYYCPQDAANRTAFTPAEVAYTAPGCTEPGHRPYVCCLVCGMVFADATLATPASADDFAIPPAHTFGDAPEYVFSGDGKTCAVRFACTLCGHAQDIPAQVSAQIVQAPTCAEKGRTLYTATLTVDDLSLNLPLGIYSATTELADIDTVAHTEEAIPTVAPTRVNDGTTAGVRCAQCGAILEAPEVVPAIGFDPLGKSDFAFPAALTAIMDDAFTALPVRILRLPEGLTAIGSGAFAGCGELRQIYIPASVTAIGEGAFAGCNADLVIYGHPGSTAEAFSTTADLPFCPIQ